MKNSLSVSFELLSCLSLFDRSLRKENFLDSDFQPPDIAWEWASLEAKESAARVLKWCRERSVSILYPGHDDYPSSFLNLENPPLFLSVMGSPAWRSASCVSVVGSREPHPRSLDWMERHLSDFQKWTQVALVSGGARGIDQKAHALAVRAGRPTVIFLPSGLAKIYPPEMADWKNEVIATGGALVSSFAPEQEIRKQHFEGRNRLIACLGKAVFVVEARSRSGSVMTARLAQELGRPVAALPSFPGESWAVGTLNLIMDGGAAMVRDAMDLMVISNLAPRTSQTKESRN